MATPPTQIHLLVFEYGVAVGMAEVRAAVRSGWAFIGYSLLVQRLFRAATLKDQVRFSFFFFVDSLCRISVA
jgi:hypothetical protein